MHDKAIDHHESKIEDENEEEIEEEQTVGECADCGSEHLLTELYDNGSEMVCENCL
jgi:ssDNA-binding Zn-finger/Zn-ribbon topoisomerase 1